MKLIRLTSIEKRAIAIVADEVLSIEKGDYLDFALEQKYNFRERPTRVLLKHYNYVYVVREDFETVYALMKGVDDE